MNDDDQQSTPDVDDREESSPPVEPTGVPAADAARTRLSELDDVPLDEHVEVFEDVHRRLQEGLADLDGS